MPLELKLVTIRDLNHVLDQKLAVRAGSTVDIERRKGEYDREGFGGTMWYAKTDNMKNAENALLERGVEARRLIHNEYGKSGQPEKPGFVYVIQGRLYS